MVEPRVDDAQLPAALPHLRAHGRPRLHALRGRHDRLRGERREGAGEHAGGAADHHVLGAAPLREDVRAGHREGRRRPAAAAEDLPLGDRRRPAGRSLTLVAEHAARGGSCRCSSRSPTSSSSRRSRRAPAAGCALRLGRRAARPRDRRVLLRRRACSICEGYGLTETSPVITRQPPGHVAAGHGRPAARARRGEDRRGRRDPDPRPARDEGLLQEPRGHRRGDRRRTAGSTPATSASSIADGFLVITDRKKDIIVTSGGKNIAPQPIENRLKTNKFVTEVVMIGDRRNFAAALVVPNFEVLAAWAKGRASSRARPRGAGAAARGRAPLPGADRRA